MASRSARKPGKTTEAPSNFAIGVQTNDRVSMPNIDKVVEQEIERITKEVIRQIEDIVIGYNTNYTTINYIPEADQEILSSINFSVDQFNGVVDQIQTALNRGLATSENYDYAKYLEMFQVRYNSITGQPEITVILEFDGFGFEDLAISKVLITRST